MPAHHDESSVSAPLWRTVFGALSPAGRRARLTILILHRVREARDEIFPNEMHAEAFRTRMRWVSSWFNVLPLEEAVARLAHGALPSRALSITFDDGYADNATVALPLLRELDLHATFFIATAYLNGGVMWNDAVIEAVRRAQGPLLDLSPIGLGQFSISSLEARKATIDRLLAALKYLAPAERQTRVDEVVGIAGAALPTDLMMSDAQVRELASAGMGIGGHTATHPILARLGADAARLEIAEGRETLESLLRSPVKLFAYPNGRPDVDYGIAHVQMVKALGFVAAVSTARGAARTDDSLYELPRFTPWGGSRVHWGARFARNFVTSSTRGSP